MPWPPGRVRPPRGAPSFRRTAPGTPSSRRGTRGPDGSTVRWPISPAQPWRPASGVPPRTTAPPIPDLSREVDEVAEPPRSSRPFRRHGARRQVGLVAHDERQATEVDPESAGRQVDVGPPEVGCAQQQPGARGHDARQGEARSDEDEAGGPTATASAARSARRSRTSAGSEDRRSSAATRRPRTAPARSHHDGSEVADVDLQAQRGEPTAVGHERSAAASWARPGDGVQLRQHAAAHEVVDEPGDRGAGHRRGVGHVGSGRGLGGGEDGAGDEREVRRPDAGLVGASGCRPRSSPARRRSAAAAGSAPLDGSGSMALVL